MNHFWIFILSVIRGISLSVLAFSCIRIYNQQEITNTHLALLGIAATAFIFSDNHINNLPQ